MGGGWASEVEGDTGYPVRKYSDAFVARAPAYAVDGGTPGGEGLPDWRVPISSVIGPNTPGAG